MGAGVAVVGLVAYVAYAERGSVDAFIGEYRSATDDERQEIVEYFSRSLSDIEMLDAIEVEFPACHSEAHPFGRAIMQRTNNIAESVEICGYRCSSGCLHGVITQLFSPNEETDVEQGDLTAERLFNEPLGVAGELCHSADMRGSVSYLQCVHGLGHVLAYLSKDDLERSIMSCRKLSITDERNACATGVFMEYMQKVDHIVLLSAKTFFPCDLFPDFTKSCYREKGRYMVFAWGEDVWDACRSLPPEAGLHCIRGIGHAGATKQKLSSETELARLCPLDDPEERAMCYAGAVSHIVLTSDVSTFSICSEMVPALRPYCVTQIEALAR